MRMTEEGRSTTTGPHWFRTVQIISATQVVVLIGFNFSFPFLPLFIQELGIHDRSELALWTGLAIGCGGISMAAVSPVWGLLADRFGRKPMLVRAIASGAIILALQAALTNVYQLVGTRILQGAFTGTQTAGAMLLAGIVPRHRTGFALGLMNTAVQVGNLIGPVLGGFVVVAVGLRTSFLVGAALLAVCAVVIAVLVTDTQRRPREELPSGFRGNARDVFVPFRWPGLRGVLIVGTLLQITYSGTSAVIAIYVQDLVRPSWLTTELSVGLALALGAMAAAVAMPILGHLADSRDARTILVASLVLVAFSLVPQVLVPDALVFLACRIPVGIGLAGVTSSIAVLTRMGVLPGQEGRGFGALASVQNLGWGIGPMAGSVLAAVAGIPALYITGAVAILVLAVVTMLTPDWFSRPSVAFTP